MLGVSNSRNYLVCTKLSLCIRLEPSKIIQVFSGLASSLDMMSFKRALVLSALFLFFIFFLYPRSQTTLPLEPEPSPGVGQVPGTNPITNHLDSRPERKTPTDRSPSIPVGPDTSIKQQQTSILSLKTLPLKDQLAYQFPYLVSSKFPAYIWQTWKYTPASAEFKEEFRVAEASWTEKHPSFVHEVVFNRAPSCGLLLILVSRSSPTK